MKRRARTPSPRMLACVVAAVLIGGPGASSALGLAPHARPAARHPRCVKHRRHRCPRTVRHSRKQHAVSPVHPVPHQPGSPSQGGSSPTGTPLATSCPIPPAPSMPSGDGALAGYLTTSGGPSPGTPDCGGVAGKIVVTGGQGQVVAAQEVPANHFFQFVLPAGQYTVTATAAGAQCGEPQTFALGAGQQSQANLTCSIP